MTIKKAFFTIWNIYKIIESKKKTRKETQRMCEGAKHKINVSFIRFFLSFSQWQIRNELCVIVCIFRNSKYAWIEPKRFCIFFFRFHFYSVFKMINFDFPWRMTPCRILGTNKSFTNKYELSMYFSFFLFILSLTLFHFISIRFVFISHSFFISLVPFRFVFLFTPLPVNNQNENRLFCHIFSSFFFVRYWRDYFVNTTKWVNSPKFVLVVDNKREWKGNVGISFLLFSFFCVSGQTKHKKNVFCDNNFDYVKHFEARREARSRDRCP